MQAAAIRLILAALVCGFLGSLARVARAEEKAATAPADEVDDDAVALLNRFGDFLKAQPRFGFSVEFGYEVVQSDGQKLEFGASRVYTIRRPDHLRIDEERRVGGKRELFFDGDQITVFSPADDAYALAKLKQHRDLDAMLDLVRDALDIPVPLGDLVRQDPTHRIEEGMTSAYIVGSEKLYGVECDHVAWRTDEVEAELWLTKGDQPLPRRVVIDYRDLEGRPSFWAQFTSWSLAPDAADSVFTFTPPASAERVRFSVRGRDVEPTEEQEP